MGTFCTFPSWQGQMCAPTCYMWLSKPQISLIRIVPQLNEGTRFSLSLLNLNTPPAQEAAVFDDFILQLLIDPTPVTSDVLDQINMFYPANDTSLGGPFNTGDSLFDRASAFYTDNMYLTPRRLLFDKAASTQKLFAYYFTEFIPGNDPTLGGKHSPTNISV